MKKILTIILTLVIFLSACSSEDSVDGDTLSYETENGVIEYKNNPSIYADYYAGEILKLDGNLIAADITYPAEPWTSIAEERNVENISGNMELVAAQQPDLIITIDNDLYDQYSAIAPTIYIPYGIYNPEEIMIEMGKILNKEEEAQAWVDQFNENIDELASMIDHPEYTVGIAEAWGDTIYMYGHNYGRGGYIIYDKLALSGTDEAEEEYIRKDDSYLVVDAESLLNYTGDVFFVVTNEDTDDGNIIPNLPTYEEIDAVKNGRQFNLDYDTFIYADPYSLDAQVQDLKEIYESDEI